MYDDRARSGFSFAMQSLLERIKLNRHHKIDPFQLWSHHLDHLRVFTCVSIFTLVGAISIASILESRLLKPPVYHLQLGTDFAAVGLEEACGSQAKARPQVAGIPSL